MWRTLSFPSALAGVSLAGLTHGGRSSHAGGCLGCPRKHQGCLPARPRQSAGWHRGRDIRPERKHPFYGQFEDVNDAGLDQQDASVYLFELPTRPANEQVVTTASFDRGLTFGTRGMPNFNADLYALRVSDPNDGDTGDDEVLTSDDGAGETPNGAATQLELQDEFLKPSNDDNDLNDSAALGSFLNANYVDGGLVFLRLNPDVVDVIADAHYTGTATDRDGLSEDQVPSLTITTVPEPASLALLGSAG